METIAITFWNGLVSPLFDAAAKVLIVGPEGARRHIEMLGQTPYAKADVLQAHGVGVLICGAISAIAQSSLCERGMRVVPWIRGSIEEVLLAYQNGSLETDSFFMPGCHRHGVCQRPKFSGKGNGCGHRQRPHWKPCNGDNLTKGKK
jgi:predicted Fe-Mo cluster-binding NifX family protein